jgi:hypothetical protein
LTDTQSLDLLERYATRCREDCLCYATDRSMPGWVKCLAQSPTNRVIAHRDNHSQNSFRKRFNSRLSRRRSFAECVHWMRRLQQHRRMSGQRRIRKNLNFLPCSRCSKNIVALRFHIIAVTILIIYVTNRLPGSTGRVCFRGDLGDSSAGAGSITDRRLRDWWPAHPETPQNGWRRWPLKPPYVPASPLACA